jgi:hypothetical protein
MFLSAASAILDSVKWMHFGRDTSSVGSACRESKSGSLLTTTKELEKLILSNVIGAEMRTSRAGACHGRCLLIYSGAHAQSGLLYLHHHG